MNIDSQIQLTKTLEQFIRDSTFNLISYIKVKGKKMFLQKALLKCLLKLSIRLLLKIQVLISQYIN